MLARQVKKCAQRKEHAVYASFTRTGGFSLPLLFPKDKEERRTRGRLSVAQE